MMPALWLRSLCVLGMLTELSWPAALAQPISIARTRAVFAQLGVQVLPCAPANAGRPDPTSVPGWANESLVWVCGSEREAISVARQRSAALVNTNTGDIYGGPLSLSALPPLAFLRLEPGHGKNLIPEGVRRFVWRNLVLEAAPSPRTRANQQQAQRLVEQLV